jgi:hypothetical protein
MWRGMQYRGSTRDTRPAYRNVELRIDRGTFIAWAVPAIKVWWEENPDIRPTIDRVDSAGHYELGNLRIASRADNNRNRRVCRNVNPPAGMAWCSGDCKDYRPVVAFHKNPTNGNGLSSHCKSCANKARNNWRRRKRG